MYSMRHCVWAKTLLQIRKILNDNFSDHWKRCSRKNGGSSKKLWVFSSVRVPWSCAYVFHIAGGPAKQEVIPVVKAYGKQLSSQNKKINAHLGTQYVPCDVKVQCWIVSLTRPITVSVCIWRMHSLITCVHQVRAGISPRLSSGWASVAQVGMPELPRGRSSSCRPTGRIQKRTWTEVLFAFGGLNLTSKNHRKYSYVQD